MAGPPMEDHEDRIRPLFGFEASGEEPIGTPLSGRWTTRYFTGPDVA